LGAIAVAILASALICGTVAAGCDQVGRHFATLNPPQYGGDSRISTYPDYYLFPGDLSVSEYAVGYFWSMRYGSPQKYEEPSAEDNDCGKQADPFWGFSQGSCGSPQEGAAASEWWKLYPAGDPRSYIGGNTSNWTHTVDGCVDWDGGNGDHVSSGLMDLGQCMLVLLADDPSSSEGYFALLSDNADEVGFYHLNESVYRATEPPVENQPIILAPVPAPILVDEVWTENDLLLTVKVREPEGLTEGRYENCPSPTHACEGVDASCVLGYRIYTQVWPIGTEPEGRNVKRSWAGKPLGICEGGGGECTSDPDCGGARCVGGWVQRAPVPNNTWPELFISFDGTSGGTATSFTEAEYCGPNLVLYVCATLVFDSGFETPYCSADLVVPYDCPEPTPGNECDYDAHCSDAYFCNGDETCSGGSCVSGSYPCGAMACHEGSNSCVAGGTAAGAMPDGDSIPGDLMTITKETGGDIRLSWGASCGAGDSGYGIYVGRIGIYYSHYDLDCTDDDGDLTEVITPPSFSSYYLVAPLSADREGSLGTDSSGQTRPPGTSVCMPRLLGTCP
jgi:hypothetical protein